MTSAREHEQPVSAPPPSLIVLNNDAIVCDTCYEPQALELDPGLIPWACIASGEPRARRARASEGYFVNSARSSRAARSWTATSRSSGRSAAIAS